jgi:hypothetical protein
LQGRIVIDLDPALVAEAKARVQRANPSLTDAQWSAWIASVTARGGRLELTIDGCVALYEREPE